VPKGDNILSEYIERYRAWGLCLIPIVHGEKVPTIKWQQYQKRQPDEAELATMFSTNTTSVAIVCGGISGNFVALDFDDLDLYIAFADYWQQFYGRPVQEMTPVIQTGSGNHHIYIKVKEKPPLFHPVGEQRKYIPDIQSEGGYVLAPPSIHPSGNPYRLLNPEVNTIHEVKSLEELAIEVPKARTHQAGSNRKIRLSQEDNERALTNLMRCAYVRHCWDDAPQLSETEWWTLIHQLVPFGDAGEELAHKFSQPYPSYSEEETTRKIESVKAAQGGDEGVGPHTCQYIQTTYGFECPPDCVAKGLHTSTPVSTAIRLAIQEKRAPSGPAEGPPGDDDHHERPDRDPLTDLGNAERLVRRHGHNIRYCYERKKWLVWNGQMWGWDYGAKVLQLAKETARSILAEASAEEDDAKRKDLVQHARRSEAENRLTAMVNLAQSETGIAITTKGLNADDWLFNCRNGTIDLRTGELRPHQRDSYITITAPVEYHPSTQSTDWEKFLTRITNKNKELRGYLQRCAGMCLTGDTGAQVMLFPYGSGENGKSTFLMVLYYVMGSYATMADPDTFMVDTRGRSGPNENLANLYGKRLVVSTEVEEGRKLSVTRVKAMTGGEEIQASRKYEHEITWRPTHKVWLSGNHKPIITDTTHAIWRRVKLIPFMVRIPEDERIDGLAEILASRGGAAILAWMVQGCMEWLTKGLQEPQTVKSATADYRGEMDLLAPFLEDCCVIGANEDVTIKELYVAYTKYCEETGERYMGKKKFGGRLREKGFDQGQRADARYWVGIGLKDDDQDK